MSSFEKKNRKEQYYLFFKGTVQSPGFPHFATRTDCWCASKNKCTTQGQCPQGCDNLVDQVVCPPTFGQRRSYPGVT